MDTIKQKTIEEYEKRIAKIRQGQQNINLLPDGLEPLGAHIYSSALDETIRVDIPFSIKTFREFRRMLGTAWRRSVAYGYYNEEDGMRYCYFRHKETNTLLTVGISPDMAGATCEKRLVGRKEVGVYEVVCH